MDIGENLLLTTEATNDGPKLHRIGHDILHPDEAKTELANDDDAPHLASQEPPAELLAISENANHIVRTAQHS